MHWSVIMAGGYGERFWPASRRKVPKQLLPILGRRTMIQQTVDRLRTVVPPSRIVVVTNAEQAPEVRRQLPAVRHVIAEPLGRNTAPCIGVAAAVIGKLDPHAVMVVVPADSCIHDTAAYRRVVRDALAVAAGAPVLITIGIQPTSPQTGYGYVQRGSRFPVPGRRPRASASASRGSRLATEFWRAKRFVEKPDRATAARFLASGEYRWNAGLFVWSLAAVAAAYERHQPAMWAACQRLGAAAGTRAFARVLAREYPRFEKISVDYAIMEKADNVVIAQGGFDWDDVGHWPALVAHLAADAAGNVARGRFVGVDAANCLVIGDDQHLIGIVGARDLIVVRTPDATLVCPKQDAQRVRELVKKLGEQKKYRRYL